MPGRAYRLGSDSLVLIEVGGFYLKFYGILNLLLYTNVKCSALLTSTPKQLMFLLVAPKNLKLGPIHLKQNNNKRSSVYKPHRLSPVPLLYPSKNPCFRHQLWKPSTFTVRLATTLLCCSRSEVSCLLFVGGIVGTWEHHWQSPQFNCKFLDFVSAGDGRELCRQHHLSWVAKLAKKIAINNPPPPTTTPVSRQTPILWQPSSFPVIGTGPVT